MNRAKRQPDRTHRMQLLCVCSTSAQLFSPPNYARGVLLIDIEVTLQFY